MFCPYCGAEDTRVKETVKGSYNKRFRLCVVCGASFETVEKPFVDITLEPYLKEVDKIEHDLEQGKLRKESTRQEKK